MSLVITETKNDYEVAPEGLQPAVCTDVVNLNMVETPWGEKHKCLLTFELTAEDSDGNRFIVSKRYTVSLNEKANLRKDLERWRGARYTSEELAEGVNLENLIGLAAMLNIQHNETEKRTYANIESILPPPEGTGYYGIKPSGEYTRVKDREAEKKEAV